MPKTTAEPTPVVSNVDPLETLASIAAQEGFGMVERLINKYRDGSNCFDRRGEGLWFVRNHEQVIAVGGINIDPYFNDDALGRIRHFYVYPEFRRAGIGASLIRTIEKCGAPHFKSFQLFTSNTGAAKFYEAHGYSPVGNQWKVSHRKTVE